MLPTDEPSSISRPADFLGARGGRPPSHLTMEDRETSNVSESIIDYIQVDWSGTCDGSVITLSAEGEEDIEAVNDIDITEFSFSFDQNQRPVVAYVAGGVAKLKWYNQAVPGMVTTVFDNTYLTPKVSLDDKNRLGFDTNDVVLGYVRAGKIYIRYQRENYAIENEWATVTSNTRIRRMGMNVQNRFQFECYYET